MVFIATSVWQTVIFAVCALWRAVYITAATLISVAEMVAEYSLTRELRLLQATAQCPINVLCHTGRSVARVLKPFNSQPESWEPEDNPKWPFHRQHGYGIEPVQPGQDAKPWC